MSIIIYSIKMGEYTRTLDNAVYKDALVHAFITITEDFDDMSYDIIEQVLKREHFYTDFLESIDYMSVVCEVVEYWSLEEFNVGIVNNKAVPTMLFKCWLCS